ncbi:hypothetical protein P691DRAFT_791175 [Macrolepiota fuliginosa MF-IS2]|uniref:Uncharacterized protein n=1 Tax=Macrolepiota fuliginosa MF-IS2 TaxID=1400762 RepID=A0A9P5XGI3_9AGAR|nr:hypothetical protein P691DRAFT_791175 [Macrolepiota fuliginosa MF-IS2]
MTIIAHLPIEIIQAIVDQVELPSRGKDLKNFRATCKYVDTILAPQVLSIAVFDLSDWRNARDLILMAAKQNHVHQFARTLKIQCLAPGGDANRPAPDIIIQRDGSYKHTDPLPKKDVLQAVQIISQYLPEALQHFHFLEVVHWRTHAFDVGDSNGALIDLLCSQENLQSVLIDMSRDIVPASPTRPAFQPERAIHHFSSDSYTRWIAVLRDCTSYSQ